MISVEKEYIMKSFNRAAVTYDEHCIIQSKVCERLMHYLKILTVNTDIIADFACGTGVSTQCLIRNFSYQKLYGIDLADKLLHRARNKILWDSGYDSREKFILCDFDDFIFMPNALDLAFSNMGFQWSVNLGRTLSTIRLQLKDDAILAFSMPIDRKSV